MYNIKQCSFILLRPFLAPQTTSTGMSNTWIVYINLTLLIVNYIASEKCDCLLNDCYTLIIKVYWIYTTMTLEKVLE